MTEPHVLSDQVEIVEPQAWTNPNVYAQLRRIYKIKGLPAIRAIVLCPTQGHRWHASAYAITADGAHRFVLDARSDVEDGYGEEFADRTVTKAARVLLADVGWWARLRAEKQLRKLARRDGS